MLDKLVLSKILLLIIFCIVTSCNEKKVYNTEIICPKVRMMVRFSKADEIRRGIERAIADKKKYDTDEKYTIVRMPGERSFVISDIAPEYAINCQFNQIPTSVRYKDYKQYYQ